MTSITKWNRGVNGSLRVLVATMPEEFVNGASRLVIILLPDGPSRILGLEEHPGAGNCQSSVGVGKSKSPMEGLRRAGYP